MLMVAAFMFGLCSYLVNTIDVFVLRYPSPSECEAQTFLYKHGAIAVLYHVHLTVLPTANSGCELSINSRFRSHKFSCRCWAL